MNMYTEIIMDYYKYPKNKGKIENADIIFKDTNPLCGDVIEMSIKVNANHIKDIKFDGQGCAISLASASLLTEMVKGKSLEEIKNLTKEELLENLGAPNLGHVRVKCAALSLKVLKYSVYRYLGEKMMGQENL